MGDASPQSNTESKLETDERSIARDVLIEVHRSMRTSAGTMIPGCLGIPAVYWWTTNRVGLLVGMAIALAVSLPIRRWLKRFDPAEHARPTRALSIANGFACGAWGLVPILMMPATIESQYLVMALPFALLAANLAATSEARAVYLAGQIPLTLTAIAAFAVFANGNARWVGVVIAVTVLALDGLARGWSETALTNAELSRNNTQLVRELEAANAVLEHRSRHDFLTGLPNRRALTDFLTSTRAGGNRDGIPGRLGIMLVDLDNFKSVNDDYGHQHGDELLRQVAGRLRSVVPETAELCRLGGDEFAVVWADALTIDDLLVAATKINRTLNEPFSVGDHVGQISASIGLALEEDDSTTATQILWQADEALYVAKANGRNQAATYDYGARLQSRFEDLAIETGRSQGPAIPSEPETQPTGLEYQHRDILS